MSGCSKSDKKHRVPAQPSYKLNGRSGVRALFMNSSVNIKDANLKNEVIKNASIHINRPTFLH